MSRTQITVTVSDELLDAVDAEAFASDETRAAAVRAILTDYLRGAGRMARKAPPTYQLGRTNVRYTQGGRR